MKRSLVVLLAVAACSSPSAPVAAPTPSPTTEKAVRARPVVAGLTAYGSCPKLRQSVRREAVAEMTPYGFERGFSPVSDVVGVLPPGTPVPAAAPLSGGSTSGGTAWTGRSFDSAAKAAQAFSGTNNQEAGVDELDAVKTDGRLLLVVTQLPQALQVLDVTGDVPKAVGELTLPSSLAGPQALLLDGKAVVVGVESLDRTRTTARVIDLSDPAHPRVERTFSVDGALVDARSVGGRVLLAVQDSPRIPVTYPLDDTAVQREHALGTNRHNAATATATAVLPTVSVSDGRTYTASCATALHPDKPSGLGTTTLVTLDPDRSAPTQTLTVVGGTSQVYASTTALYLTTQQWRTTASTELHGFDITDPDHPVQLGSGSVPGSVVDRYALSATADEVRIATTTGGTDSRVTVLRPRNGRLAQVGVVSGLGKGEQIYGVRYVGDLAYVVTFRQTDPLYVVDLTDGTRPRVRGALKVTGYSSALYPLGEGQLLGVGQDFDAQGLARGGAQVSVFDVADPDDPRLVGKQVFPGYSPSQEDHHALTWWPSRRLVVLPRVDYAASAQQQTMLALRVGDDGHLTELGQWSARAPLTRSVVIGDLLYSVSEQGVDVAPLDRLSEHTWTPFS